MVVVVVEGTPEITMFSGTWLQNPSLRAIAASKVYHRYAQFYRSILVCSNMVRSRLDNFFAVYRYHDNRPGPHATSIRAQI